MDGNAVAVTGAHRLDFVVLGTARSGTTALSRAINLDPNCYCASEYFHGTWTADYAEIAMPEGFFDARWRASTPQNTARSRRLLQDKLAAGTVRTYGNKHPNYFLILEHLHRQLPALRSVALYRTPAEIAASWDKRAANPSDRWHEGRTGIYGVLEWLIALGRLANTAAPVKILDYNAMFYDDPSLMPRMIEFVAGRAPDQDVVAGYLASEFRHGGKAGRASDGLPHQDFLHKLGVPHMDAEIRTRGFFPAREFSTDLGLFFKSALESAFNHAAETLSLSTNPAEVSFAFRWAHNVARIYDDPASDIYRMLAQLSEGLLNALAPKVGEEEKKLAGTCARLMKVRMGGERR